MKVAIIGTGISGLSIAQMLKEKHDVTLFERSGLEGGLIKCERINDCLFHKVGGHVFNAKNKAVLDWFWNHFDREEEFSIAKRKAQILLEGKIIGYPIENFIYKLGNDNIDTIIKELMELEKPTIRKPSQYFNFETFLKKNFGETLYNLYFKPYNEKIWQTDLDKIPLEWLEGKLPMPNLNDIIKSNIIRQEELEMVHSSFYYPKNEGSQFIVNRLKKNLKIHINCDIKAISTTKKCFSIDGKLFDKIIYTGDIRNFPPFGKKIMSDEGVDVSYLENLRSNGTSNLFCETDPTDMSWLYIPENFTKAHRIIYTGNFSQTNSRGSSRQTCVVEFSGRVDYHAMIDEIKKLPGNLSPFSSNYEPNSYVIQDSRTRYEISAAKKALGKHGIHLLGRFAEWEYYNMDTAIESAMDLSSFF